MAGSQREGHLLPPPTAVVGQFVKSLLPFAVLTLPGLSVGRLQRRLRKDPRVEELESQVENPEPRDVWNRSGEIHIYRDPGFPRDRAPLSHVGLGDLMIGLFLVVPVVAIVGFANGFTVSDRIQGAVALGLFLAIVYFGDRRHRNHVCGEIRLSEDGTCELESKRRMISLHVNQIESVKCPNDPDSRAAYYILPGRKRLRRAWNDGLHRLPEPPPEPEPRRRPERFPCRRLAGSGSAATERGTLVDACFRGASSPDRGNPARHRLASQTLLGK
jgi:hypothetical protein